MTIRFRWLEAPPDFVNDTYAEPPPWPQSLLQRHGGRMLKPTEAAGVLVESTAYRADTLLIPDFVAGDPEMLGRIGDLIDATLPLPPALAGVLGNDDNKAARLRELPRAVAVVPNPPRPDSKMPFDAWTAVQEIRAAADDLAVSSKPDPDKYKEELRWDARRKALRTVSLDHLLVGTSFGGVPTYEPQDPRVPNYPGGYAPEGRHPVSALVLKPVRTDLGTEPSEVPKAPPVAKRHPVIVVLDTGLRQHPWFEDLDKIAAAPPSDDLLHIDVPTQDAINKHQPLVDGLRRTNVLSGWRDEPIFAEELAERVNPAVGHGTFITGLIHQHAPNANVRSVRVLRPDNVGYESDVLLAMWMLADEVDQHQQGKPGRMIDIVSISLGYYHETWLSDKATRLGAAIDRLTGLGVLVVASAGNDSSARAFLPAAISSLPRPAPQVPPANQLPPPPPVIGVGALNPNSKTSWYSNGGASASCEAPGTCLISIFPPDVVGSNGPMNIAPDFDRESVDQDDYRGAYAMWSGTSFATPLVAAALARELIRLNINRTGLGETRQRALDALHALADSTQQAELAELQRRVDEITKQYDDKFVALKEQIDDEQKARKP